MTIGTKVGLAKIESRLDRSAAWFFAEAYRDKLEKAKRFLQLQLPGAFETTGSIASQVVPVVLYGLPLDYYNGYVQQIDRVTQADVQRVARQYVDPSNVVVVVVGDRKSIESGLRSLGVGDIVVRDLDGRQVTGPAAVPRTR